MKIRRKISYIYNDDKGLLSTFLLIINFMGGGELGVYHF